MIITPEEVQRIAQLGRLELTAEEISAATAHLSGVLEHFSQIQEIDTEHTPAAADASGLVNVTRADDAKPDSLCEPEELLKRAPSTKDNQIKVQAAL